MPWIARKTKHFTEVGKNAKFSIERVKFHVNFKTKLKDTVFARPRRARWRVFKALSQPKRPIDDTDRRIIRSLLVDARTPCQQIAKEFNVHPSTVAYRIRKLLESGVIKKFSISVDWRKLGKNVEAAILIDAAQRDVRKLAEHLSSLDEVIEVHSVAGYHDLLIMVAATDMDEFRRFLEDKLGKIPQIEKINTAIVMEDFKEE